MRSIQIVTDSSANRLPVDGLSVAALKVITDEREFTDNADLDLDGQLAYFEHYKGKSQTSCPNAGDFLEAFGNADDIICLTITSALSGSYNAAASAMRIYCEEHPGRRVFVLDSLTAGAELGLMVDRALALSAEGAGFEAICTDLQAYRKETGLLFMLKSLKNFAANGRVSPSVALIAGLAGICVIGRASTEGTLEPTDKCRGEAKSFVRIAERLRESGLSHGRVEIAHCQNEAGAEALRGMLREQFPEAQITVTHNRGLCSYYAERGGLLIGFEKK